MYQKLKRILVCTVILGILFVLLCPSVFAMQVFIEITESKHITLETEPTQTILQLKTKLQENEGIPISQQVLMFNDTVLEDNNTLQGYNIQKDSTIHLVLNHTHSYGEWETTIERTCLTAGERKKTCPCGNIITEVVPKLELHTYGEWETIKPPTKQEQGLEQRRCLVCKKILETRNVAQLKPAPPVAPQTGDTTPIGLIITIAIIALSLVIFCIIVLIYLHKNNKKDN